MKTKKGATTIAEPTSTAEILEATQPQTPVETINPTPAKAHSHMNDDLIKEITQSVMEEVKSTFKETFESISKSNSFAAKTTGEKPKFVANYETPVILGKGIIRLSIDGTNYTMISTYLEFLRSKWKEMREMMTQGATMVKMREDDPIEFILTPNAVIPSIHMKIPILKQITSGGDVIMKLKPVLDASGYLMNITYFGSDFKSIAYEETETGAYKLFYQKKEE